MNKYFVREKGTDCWSPLDRIFGVRIGLKINQKDCPGIDAGEFEIVAERYTIQTEYTAAGKAFMEQEAKRNSINRQFRVKQKMLFTIVASPSANTPPSTYAYPTAATMSWTP
jgi:hypothetical protein